MQAEKVSRILVAIDGSDVSMSAAEMAISLAKKDGREIYAISVVHVPAPSIVFYGKKVFDEYVKRSRNEAEGWLERIVKMASAQELPIHTKVLEGFESVAHAITSFAEEKRVDLIVVGSRGRTGFERMLLGSVALGVVTYSTCPVMVVR